MILNIESAIVSNMNELSTLKGKKKLRFSFNYYGSGIALGIRGNKEEIQKFGNALYNFGGTKGEVHFMNENKDDGFAYVLSSKEELVKGLENAFFTAQIIKALKRQDVLPREKRRFKGERGGPKKIAVKLAQRFVNALVLENFIQAPIQGKEVSLLGSEKEGSNE